MINKKFALGTWEIHLQEQTERTLIFDRMNEVCEYIDTAVDYNNDWLLANQQNYKIISKVSSFHESEYEFFVSNHLKCLRREKIDIMLIHSNRGNWRPIAEKIEKDNRFLEIGVSNFTKKDLIEYNGIFGHYPAYNEIEINPHYGDLETITFCKENNIKIISYGILCGKYNAMRAVAAYTLPALVNFAAKYADIVILKPDSLRHVYEFIDTVKNYSDENATVLEFVETANKAVEPMAYSAMPVSKSCLGKASYSISCGKNNGKLAEEEQHICLPKMEMLGDYMTYLRYYYRQNYTNNDVYYYDFLIGDDGNYYAVYLYDENNNITKINKYDKIKVFKYMEE